MSILDSVTGAMEQGGEGTGASLLGAGMALIERCGGLQGLIDKLHEGGLSEVVSSWVGSGANQPVSGQALHSALGSDLIADVAQRFGMSSEQLSEGLARLMPQMVDKATPDGEVKEGHEDLLQKGMSELGGLFGN